MNKTALIITVLTLAVVAACGSSEGAQDLHDRLVAAGKLEISETKGFSISSLVPSAALNELQPIDTTNGDTTLAEEETESPSVPLETSETDEQPFINDLAVAQKTAAIASPVIYYVTFSNAAFVVEKDGKEVLTGEWDAVSGEAIYVVINDHEKELDVELNGSKIKLADNADEYSDGGSTSTSSGNGKKPQIGASEGNSSTHSKPHKKKCYDTWGYTYGYNPANGKYDYHNGPTQNCF